MLQALNTGHSGLSTGHSNNPKDMLSRLEAMTLMANDIPLAAVRSQIAAAIDVMVHLGRLRDKSRRVLQIVEVGEYADGEIQLNPLFCFVENAEEEVDEKSFEKKKRRDDHARSETMRGESIKNERVRMERVCGALKKVGELQAVEKLRSAGYPV